MAILEQFQTLLMLDWRKTGYDVILDSIYAGDETKGRIYECLQSGRFSYLKNLKIIKKRRGGIFEYREGPEPKLDRPLINAKRRGGIFEYREGPDPVPDPVPVPDPKTVIEGDPWPNIKAYFEAIDPYGKT